MNLLYRSVFSILEVLLSHYHCKSNGGVFVGGASSLMNGGMLECIFFGGSSVIYCRM